MAGEWIPIDCCLWEKLEVLRISKATGKSTNEVVGNLARLWAWASHNVADGRIECGIDDLEMVIGADEAFWRAVVSVGWLIDDGESLQIPGWEARFCQTAKSRLLANRRMKRHRDGAASQGVTHERHSSVAPCNGTALHLETVRRNQIEEIEEIEEKEEKRGEETPTGDSSSSVSEIWDDFKARWAATAKTTGKGPKKPAKGFTDARWELGYDRVLQALAMIPRCDYFESPVTMTQFFSDGFIDRILEGHFSGRSRKRGKPPDDDRPPREFEGDDAKRFAATLERIRSEGRVR